MIAYPRQDGPAGKEDAMRINEYVKLGVDAPTVEAAKSRAAELAAQLELVSKAKLRLIRVEDKGHQVHPRFEVLFCPFYEGKL